MLELKTKQEEFLYAFTEEVIRIVKRRLDKEERERRELLRAKRQVEIEKLRQRFSKYGEPEKKPEPKPIPVQEKKEEKQEIFQPILINMQQEKEKPKEEPAKTSLKNGSMV